MVNDLLETNRDVFSYADDTMLFVSADTVVDAISAATSKYYSLSAWYGANGLSLCPTKTTYIMYSNRQIPSDLNIILENCSTPVETSVRMLGVTLDSKLIFLQHTQRLVLETNHALYALRYMPYAKFDPT